MGSGAVFFKCLPSARCCSSSVDTVVSKTDACVGLGGGEVERQTTDNSRRKSTGQAELVVSPRKEEDRVVMGVLIPRGTGVPNLNRLLRLKWICQYPVPVSHFQPPCR